MDKNSQIVCLVVNCFNSEKYLIDTLQSLVEQTYKNIRILCINNKSTDNTAEIIDDFAKTDERIISFDLEVHMSLVEARNFAVSKISEMENVTFFGFCDSDDLWHEDWVTSLIDISQNADIVFCNGFYLYQETGSLVKVDNCLSKRTWDTFSSPLHLQSALFSKRLIRNDKFFDERLKIIYDLDYFINLKKFNFRYVHISDNLFTYRIHGESLSSTKLWRIFVERLLITRKHKLSLLVFFLKYVLIVCGVYKIRKKLTN